MNTPLLSNGVGELSYSDAVPVPLLAYQVKEAIPLAASGDFGDFLFQEIPTPEAVVWYNNYLLIQSGHFKNTGRYPKLELQFCMNNSFNYHGEGIGKRNLRDGSFNMVYVPVVNSEIVLRPGRIYTTLDIYLTPIVIQRLELLYPVLETFLGQISRGEAVTLCPINQLMTISMHDIIDNILDNVHTDGRYTLYVATKVNELLLTILDRVTHHPKLTEVYFREEELQLIYEAKDLLLANLDKPMTLALLSKAVGLNKNKLKSGFLQLYDCTVTSFRLHARMKEAKFLLRTTKDSIERIAFDTGYANAQHFSKVYQVYYGNTPARYRKDME